MFETQWQTQLQKQLKRVPEHIELEDSQDFFNVELGLYLLEMLQWSDEPVQVLWTILAGLPISTPKLQNLTTEQTRAIANARILLSFGRYRWEQGLLSYQMQPAEWRKYDVADLNAPLQSNPNGPTHFLERIPIYQDWLSRPIAYAESPKKIAGTGVWKFKISDEEPRIFSASFAESFPLPNHEAIPSFTAPQPNLPPRSSIQLSWSQLHDTAVAVDERRQARDLDGTPWVWLLEEIINLRVQNEVEQFESFRNRPLTLSGLTHLAGMVGAGKSTLMKLIAAHTVLMGKWRISLIVGDVQTAVQLADELNRILCDDSNQPVAVAITGRTTRDTHLRRLHNATTYRPDHWGLRWLDTRCPLQAFIQDDDFVEPLPLGSEPCERRLYTTESSRERVSCPLFAQCPSRQMDRDIPNAKIWITTPGAMSASRLHHLVSPHQMRVGELIYHHSDLVIFDEVDAVQQFFDQIYAKSQWLIDEKLGLLDMLDSKTAVGLSKVEESSNQNQRWITAERGARLRAENLVTHIQDRPNLRQWIGKQYFTARRLFQDLANTLVGDNPNSDVFSWFDKYRTSKEEDSYSSPVGKLHIIGLHVAAYSGRFFSNKVQRLCQEWLRDHVPNLEENLTEEQSIEMLGERLEFAILVTALEEMSRITIEEWYSAPLFITKEVSQEKQAQHIIPDLIGVLPTAPTGGLYGFLYQAEQSEGTSNPFARRLQAFQYRAIGRWYLLHFHDLLEKLGYGGPHVLAMSGTSWLPDAPQWHFDVAPQALLTPNQQNQRAIEQSRFFFSPRYDSEGRPIFVSGSGKLDTQLRALARQIATQPSNQACLLEREWGDLGDLAANETQWADRERILLFVNSYDQVQTVISTLLQYRPEWRETIYGLKRRSATSNQADWIMAQDNWHVARADIEQFGQVANGRLLVAPISAIGRGYNILNENRVAAFGSVFFLTRPMPHPFDLLARAQWVNRYTLQHCQNPNHRFWSENNTLFDQNQALRIWAHAQWDTYDNFRGVGDLPSYRLEALAAYLTGIIIQACGRLLRGGVPFRTHFLDASWAKHSAMNNNRLDTVETSLLLAMRQRLSIYCENPVGQALYAPLATALQTIHGLRGEEELS